MSERVPEPDFMPLAMASGRNSDGTYTAIIRVQLQVEDNIALRAEYLLPPDAGASPDMGTGFALARSLSETIRRADWGHLTPTGADIWAGEASANIPGEQFPAR